MTANSEKSFTRFAIFLDKNPKKEATKEIISQHIEHLRRLDAEGLLVLCGPFTDHPSGLVVVNAKDKEEAMRIAEADPFVVSEVRSFEIRTWLLACAENNYLG